MKIRKISLLLAAIFIINMLTVLPAGAKTVQEDKYKVICALGFFDETNVYGPNAGVTRGEIVKALINSLPKDKILKCGSENTGFSDVGKSDPMAEAAYNARIRGIMGEEAELKANELADLEDASFMILNLLGYGRAIKENYAAYASELGITKSISPSEKFTVEQLVTMLYNALEVNLIKAEYTGDTQKLVQSDDTYLTGILEVKKGSAQVTAEKNAALYGYEPTGNSDVRIGNETYLASKTDAGSHIGEYADFYYRTEDKELLYIKCHDEKSILEMKSDNIDNFNNLTYTYHSDENERSKTAKISKGADVIYNGKLIDDSLLSYSPKNGSVKLIDNDSDGKYEIVIIVDYASVTVDSTNNEDGIIREMYRGETYKVDLYSDNVCTIADNDGNIRKFSDIVKYMTVFIAKAQDGSIYKILITDDKIRGSVSRTTEKTVEINNTSYKMSDDFKTYAAVKLYTYGTFYCDPFGRIASYEGMVEKNLKSGYIIKASKAEEEIEDDILIMRIFTEAGKIENLYTAKNVYITDGNEAVPTRTKAANSDVILSVIDDAKSNEYGGGQLILYKQNGAGRITDIETAAKYNDNLTVSDNLNKKGIFRQMTQKKKETHRHGLFYTSFRIGPDTKVYNIPSDLSNTNKFEVYTGTTNCFQYNTQYYAISFTKQTDATYADYVLGFLGGEDGAVDDLYVFVVEDVNRGLNDDDEPVKIISGMWGSARKEFKLSADLSEKDINSGDVYRLGFDDSGDVLTMIKVYDVTKHEMVSRGSMGDTYFSYAGYAYDYVGNNLRVCMKDPAAVTSTKELNIVFGDKQEQVYKYNTKTHKLTTTDYTDAKTYKKNPGSYSKVFVWLRWGYPKTFVIYE